MPAALYDLLVIGGGINGAGIARDAAGRGLGVLLVERRDLGSATSSASSKLIHGGLRYLEHYEFRLVGEDVDARAIANVAGPWVKRVLNERLGQPSTEAVRLVQGSHIVIPRRYEGEHAFLLQNDDRRVVFMIPFEERFTLIGTTDVALQ